MGTGRGVLAGLEMRQRAAPQPSSGEQEIELLKSEVKSLEQELAEIQRRLENLEKQR